MRKILTLCVVLKNKQILLGMKKRGFGAGRWNGFGGKVEEGESIAQAASRELLEEVGIRAHSLDLVGVLEFTFLNDSKILEVHVFTVAEFSGEPIESEEMAPQWFALEDIPYGQMWTDDAHWLPLLLSGKKFAGKFLFDKPSTAEYAAKIVSQELREVSSL